MMRKGEMLVFELTKYIKTRDIIGVHPTSWNAWEIENMTDEEFDEQFKDLLERLKK